MRGLQIFLPLSGGPTAAAMIKINPQSAPWTWFINVGYYKEVNAFALANGRLIITHGMIALCANDDELAGVLAHEMAHSLAEHQREKLTMAEKAKYANLGVTLVTAILTG